MSHTIRLALLVFFIGCNPIPQAYPCRVLTIETGPEVKVLKNYGQSYFGTECPAGTPEEILIPAEGYDIYMYFQPQPRVFVGVEASSPGYSFVQEDWRQNSPHSVRSRATHFKDLAGLVGDPLKSMSPITAGNTTIHVNPNVKPLEKSVKFKVTDPSGKIHEHSYPFAIKECICKQYDAV